MRILAIESSTLSGSVAVLDNESVVAEILLDPGKRTTRTLSPALQQILQQEGWQPSDVQCVAVSVGPGSFTGLRIGVTVAKTFAYATGAKVLGVSTLEVLAAQVPPGRQLLWAVMNAERAQLFAACFHVENDQWIESAPPGIVDVSTWTQTLVPGTLVTGPALSDLPQPLPNHVTPVAANFWTPRAGTVGQVAFRHFQAGRLDDIWSLVPRYFRDSAAQEKAK